MGLFPRKSEEERIAEAAERERRRLAADRARADQVAHEHRLQAERAAHLQRTQAAAAAHAAALPKWEYKVLTATALAGFGDGKVENVEPMLNQYASEGWRVISISFTGQIAQALATDKNHLYVVLERPATGAGHTGHPVVAPVKSWS